MILAYYLDFSHLEQHKNIKDNLFNETFSYRTMNPLQRHMYNKVQLKLTPDIQSRCKYKSKEMRLYDNKTYIQKNSNEIDVSICTAFNNEKKNPYHKVGYKGHYVKNKKKLIKKERFIS